MGGPGPPPPAPGCDNFETAWPGDSVRVSQCPALRIVRDDEWLTHQRASAKPHSRSRPAPRTDRKVGLRITFSERFVPPVSSIAMARSTIGIAVCGENLDLTSTGPLRFGPAPDDLHYPPYRSAIRLVPLGASRPVAAGRR